MIKSRVYCFVLTHTVHFFVSTKLMKGTDVFINHRGYHTPPRVSFRVPALVSCFRALRALARGSRFLFLPPVSQFICTLASRDPAQVDRPPTSTTDATDRPSDTSGGRRRRRGKFSRRCSGSEAPGATRTGLRRVHHPLTAPARPPPGGLLPPPPQSSTRQRRAARRQRATRCYQVEDTEADRRSDNLSHLDGRSLHSIAGLLTFVRQSLFGELRMRRPITHSPANSASPAVSGSCPNGPTKGVIISSAYPTPKIPPIHLRNS